MDYSFSPTVNKSENVNVFAVMMGVGSDPTIDQVEHFDDYPTSTRDRFIAGKLFSDASLIPEAHTLVKEYTLRKEFDDNAKLKKDVSLHRGVAEEGATSIIAASNFVETAITELNLLVELTNSLQNSGRLTTKTSFQVQDSSEDLTLPLPQRLALATSFYKNAARSLSSGHAKLRGIVLGRQSYASKVSKLSKAWPLVQTKGDSLAVDCSFGNLPRLTRLNFASDIMTVQPLPVASDTLSTISVQVVDSSDESIFRISAWSLLCSDSHRLVDLDSEDLVAVDTECRKRSHDAFARQFFQQLVTGAITMRQRPFVRSTAPTSSESNPAPINADAMLSELLKGTLDSITTLTETTLRLPIDKGGALCVAIIPIEEHIPTIPTSSSSSASSVHTVLSLAMLKTMKSYLQSISVDAKSSALGEKVVGLKRKANADDQGEMMTELLQRVFIEAQRVTIRRALHSIIDAPALCRAFGSKAITGHYHVRENALPSLTDSQPGFVFEIAALGGRVLVVSMVRDDSDCELWTCHPALSAVRRLHLPSSDLSVMISPMVVRELQQFRMWQMVQASRTVQGGGGSEDGYEVVIGSCGDVCILERASGVLRARAEEVGASVLGQMVVAIIPMAGWRGGGWTWKSAPEVALDDDAEMLLLRTKIDMERWSSKHNVDIAKQFPTALAMLILK